MVGHIRSPPLRLTHRLFWRLSSQLVELKNGETFNGHLVNCDNFMNITLREVYQTSADGDRFWKVKECYIRGSTVR
jgi:small nuclear ribonucleoprotein (snRNP)-like protein